jgi:hypothetical protein
MDRLAEMVDHLLYPRWLSFRIPRTLIMIRSPGLEREGYSEGGEREDAFNCGVHLPPHHAQI